MFESSITPRGQTTVPAAVRRAIGAVPGSTLIWRVMPDCRLFVRVKGKSTLKAGALTAPRPSKSRLDR